MLSARQALCTSSQQPYPVLTGVSTRHATNSATMSYRTFTFTCPDRDLAWDALHLHLNEFPCIILPVSLSAFGSTLHQPSVTESSGHDMDPTDLTAIHQALNPQGARVERHERMPQGVMESLQTLTSNVSQIGHQVNLLTSQPPASSLTTPVAVSNPIITSSVWPPSPPAK